MDEAKEAVPPTPPVSPAGDQDGEGEKAPEVDIAPPFREIRTRQSRQKIPSRSIRRTLLQLSLIHI